MKGSVSAKGQVTIPATIRRRLGLTAGTAVRFELVKAGALLTKGLRGRHPVDTVYGKLRLPRLVDAIIDEMRGPRPKRVVKNR